LLQSFRITTSFAQVLHGVLRLISDKPNTHC
jgi:hypothetical protein